MLSTFTLRHNHRYMADCLCCVWFIVESQPTFMCVRDTSSIRYDCSNLLCIKKRVWEENL